MLRFNHEEPKSTKTLAGVASWKLPLLWSVTPPGSFDKLTTGKEESRGLR
jgi:hypothetical protein